MTEPGRYVEVAVPLPIFSTFTYSVPSGWDPRPGSRVLAPFGRRKLVGLVVGRRRDSRHEGEIKPIESVLDEEPLISSSLIELGVWISRYYVAPPGEAFRIMLPPGLVKRKITDSDHRRENSAWPARRQLAVIAVSASQAPDGSSPRQRAALEFLNQCGLPVTVQDFVAKSGISVAVLKALERKSAIRIAPVEVERSPWEDATLGGREAVKRHRLNDEQSRIFEQLKAKIEAGGFSTVLLHGVTGSGKTEIYLNAIELVLARGKTALMLVPEIGLTPQMSRYLKGWFGEMAAILHSGLSEGERFDQWRRIREGHARVVIGTRSAVFAPLSNLGIVVVDEEHDASYKQAELPRYNARDTALKRAQIEKSLVVLGSATPQLETYYAATGKGMTEYESISSRVLERALPTVHLVDMRLEFQRKGKATIISDLLNQKIAERVKKGEQVLVLLNRRGYSPLLLCRSCGHTEVCEHCSVSLTYHQQLNRLSCHYCGYSRSVPQNCSVCGKEYLHFAGEGTEKVQEYLSELFPQARIDRLDRDSISRKGRMAGILTAFARGKTDILVGTQMIAKGHDFPGVTLVGVLAADKALKLADFRAAERTFQLLTQVAGRAGRGDRPGEVVIQTYYPDHYALKFACAQDYASFYEHEIEFRRRFRYPPLTALANLVVRGEDQSGTLEIVDLLTERLTWHRKERSSPARMRILGPAPAALERLKKEFRYQILIKTTSRKELHDVLEGALTDLQQRHISLKRISVDIDPVNLL